MAKSEVPAPATPRQEPIIRVSWPGEGIKTTGDQTGWQKGRKIRVVVEGTVTGFSHGEYGCDISVKGSAVKVDDLGGAEPMADTLKKGRARASGGATYGKGA